MGTFGENLRARPQAERNALFFWWVAAMSVPVGIVILFLGTPERFTGVIFFAAALLEAALGAWQWSRRPRR